MLVPSMSVAVSLAMADLVTTAVIAAAPTHQTVMHQAAAFASGVPAVVLFGDLMDVACGVRLVRGLILNGRPRNSRHGPCEQQSCRSE